MSDDELPRALAVAWGMYEAPARGPKREMSHERIVEAAIEIADRDGLGAVTMARVAEALGFTTMSLYRYLAGKDELLALMQDEAGWFDGALAVDADDWQQGLRDFAAIVTTVYRRHPWLVDLPTSVTQVLMPNSLTVADAAMRAMRTLPLPPPERQGVLLLVTLVVRAFIGMQRDLVQQGQDYPPGPATVDLMNEVVTTARFPDLAPMVRSGLYLGLDASDDVDDLQYALDVVLEGLAGRAGRFAASGGHPAEQVEAEPLGPQDQLAVAEHELATLVAQRKQAEQRAKDLAKKISAAEKVRDRAREVAKASAKQ